MTRGVRATVTAEPGGTRLGEEIRRLVLHARSISDDLDPRADALLFAAGRAQHVARRIRPALDSGEWVICARYLDSSLAYQGGGYGLDLDTLRTLQAFATGGLKPDLTILLDVPVDIGLRRKRKDRWNRFEDTESAAFFERVRERTFSWPPPSRIGFGCWTGPVRWMKPTSPSARWWLRSWIGRAY